MKHAGIDYRNPTKFRLKQRILLRVIPPLLALFVRILRLTLRFETRGAEHFESSIGAGTPAILAIWHEGLAQSISYYVGSNFHGLTSYSYDGELAARMLSWLGCEAVRGSSSRGGAEALHAMEQALNFVPCVGITMDGPRGPARESKAGIAVLAARSQKPILPNVFSSAQCWRLKSWDKFVVPKPFTRVICAYGPLIPPPPTETVDDVERVRARVEAETRALQEEIDLAVLQAR